MAIEYAIELHEEQCTILQREVGEEGEVIVDWQLVKTWPHSGGLSYQAIKAAVEYCEAQPDYQGWVKLTADRGTLAPLPDDD